MQKKYLSLAICAILSPAFVVAQDSLDNQENPDTVVLDTVVVESVYAVPAERDNTGASVTVLTEKDFQQRGVTYVLDALKTVPSIAIDASGGRGTLSRVFMRGGAADHTLVVIDGVKANAADGNAFNFGLLPLSQIERIEILRGEQSALWGSDAIGGVINIQTKSGKYADKAFNADIHLGGGSGKTADFSTTLYGRQGGLYYSINAAHHRSQDVSASDENRFDFIARDGTAIVTGGALEKDKFQQTAGALSIGYEFERAGIEALLKHSTTTAHNDNSGTGSARLAGTAFDTVLENANNPRAKIKENTFKLSGYLGSRDDLVYQSAYWSQNNQKTTSYAYNSWANAASQTEARGKKTNVGYQIDVNFDRDGATTQAVSGLLEYQKNSLKQSSFGDSDKHIQQKSVALEYRLFNENDHALSVGIRHDNNSRFKNATTYRLSGGYRLSDNFRLHASLGSGIKNPTLIEYYGWAGTWQGNPNLKPEKSRGGELGLLIEDNSGNHALDITYFNRRVTDLIRSEATQSVNQTGKSNIRGLELSYNGQLTPTLSAYANYTYTKALDNRAIPLVRIPKNTANVGVNYQFNDALAVYGNIHYQGKRSDLFFGAFPFSTVDMPAYTLVNVGANYRINDNIETYFNINNVFDKKHENILGYGQPERSFYLGFKGRF